MPKFISHDGVDANGIRAEVTVEVGTGYIKAINPRHKPDGSEGSNVEIVFEPDNKKLTRKVYGSLDKNATELYDYAKQAFTNKTNVTYRIESQRKRGVDRTTKYEDLVHTEEVVRILAALDNVFSHEAKTNPEEDPSRENPSALPQNNGGKSFAHPAPDTMMHESWENISALIAKNSMEAFGEAKKTNLPSTLLDVLAATALATGVPFSTVYPTAGAGTRLDVAAEAEQFALDHLIVAYSSDAAGPITVTDEIVSQAGAIAVRILHLADTVHATSHDALPDHYQHQDTHKHALHFVEDAIAKRYPFPLGQDVREQSEWEQNILREANTRLYGLAHIAAGDTPRLPETASPTPSTAKKTSKSKKAAQDPPAPTVADLYEEAVIPQPGDQQFIAPTEELVTRLKVLCVNADVVTDPAAISKWLWGRTGQKSAKNIHAPVLLEIVETYEHADPSTLRAHIYG